MRDMFGETKNKRIRNMTLERENGATLSLPS